MKAALIAIALYGAFAANAAPSLNTSSVGSLASELSAPSFQAANRKGSTRVGGSNSKGKGSRYIGGRRR